MKTRIRQWLRSLIGWDEIPAHDLRLETLTARLEEAEEHLKGLDAKISPRRDTAHAPYAITDWETAQAAYLHNPKNFEQGKES